MSCTDQCSGDASSDRTGIVGATICRSAQRSSAFRLSSPHRRAAHSKGRVSATTLGTPREDAATASLGALLRWRDSAPPKNGPVLANGAASERKERKGFCYYIRLALYPQDNAPKRNRVGEQSNAKGFSDTDAQPAIQPTMRGTQAETLNPAGPVGWPRRPACPGFCHARLNQDRTWQTQALPRRRRTDIRSHTSTD